MYGSCAAAYLSTFGFETHTAVSAAEVTNLYGVLRRIKHCKCKDARASAQRGDSQKMCCSQAGSHHIGFVSHVETPVITSPSRKERKGKEILPQKWVTWLTSRFNPIHCVQTHQLNTQMSARAIISLP